MRHHRLVPPLVTSGISLTVYWLTLAPDLTWANFGRDGGELITTAVTLGVPHPPGYPTYVLLGKVFSWLPVGPVAFRLNLLSAMSVALAAGLVTAVNQAMSTKPQTTAHGLFTENLMPAIAAGLTLAFAPLVWGQALISEVYGLNLLCLAIFLWALFTARPSWLVGLLLGLSVTTHLTALLMLPLVVILTGRRCWLHLSAGFVVGLTPFLLIPLLANSGSPVVWGHPVTWRGWWWLVSGQLYHANLFAVPWRPLLARLHEWAMVLPAQFLWVGFVMIGVGAVRLVKSREPSVSSSHYSVDRSPYTDYWLLTTVLTTAVLYIIYALAYNTPDALVFTLPALLLCAMLLGVGLRYGGAWSLGLPLLLLLLNFQPQNLRSAVLIRPLATQLLVHTPADALLLSSDEATTFTLWYFHHVESHRPDLIIVDTHLFAFDWYRDRLRSQHADLWVPGEDDLTAFYTRNAQTRPLCHVHIMPATDQPVGNSCLEK